MGPGAVRWRGLSGMTVLFSFVIPERARKRPAPEPTGRHSDGARYSAAACRACSAIVACAAASRAIGTRNGEQLT